MNYIDLFAGAGGLSEGFLRAGLTPIAHVEMDPEACLTLQTRLAYYHLRRTDKLKEYQAYLERKITRAELHAKLPPAEFDSVLNCAISKETRDDIFAKIDGLRAGKQVDLIIGGPPCQAYSVAGRARLKNEVKDDPRNFLYVQYAEFLRKYKPKMFVFENVLGLLSAKNGEHLRNIRRIVEKSGYDMDIRQFDAGDFNVLQSRKRLIIIGWQKNSGWDYPRLHTKPQKYLVENLLSDLPKLRPGEAYTGPYPTGTTNYLRESGIRPVDWPILTQHIARPHIDRDIETYRDAITLWKEGKRLCYDDLPEERKTHVNKTGFKDRFKVVAMNRATSQTVVAHIHKDGHYYIHPDYDQGRSISVREAARLQSFPDDYYFEGSRTAALKQIGNAVPPLLALEIACRVVEMIEGRGEVCQAKPPKERQAVKKKPVPKPLPVTSAYQTHLFPGASSLTTAVALSAGAGSAG